MTLSSYTQAQAYGIYIIISYNTGKSALPDIYAQHPRWVSIYKAKHECLCYNKINMLYFQQSKIHPNLKATAQLAYVVTDADCDYGSSF